MAEAEQDNKEQVTKPEAAAPVHSHKKMWQVLGIAMLCFVGSFLGAWGLLASGLVKPDASRTITENKQVLVSQQGEVIAEVFKKVSPSTVAITTQATVDSSQRFLAQQVSEGAGSGIIISKDGYVLTNKHVVPAGTTKVTVVTAEGKQYTDVKVIGRDPSNDLAFLKINGVTDLTPAELGDSNTVAPGQQVVAIGNALGLFRNSVTSGIISGTGRPIQATDETGATAEQLEDLLQTDAAINPGNSGGPLLDLNGKVIGINTAISQEGQSIGFAIPVNAAKGLITGVLKSGKIIKPYLGVRYITLDAEAAQQLNVSTTEGALLRSASGSPAVVPGGPADKAGLKEGDIITRVNGMNLVFGSSLATKLAQFSPGEKVDLTVMREGKEQVINATLGEFPQ